MNADEELALDEVREAMRGDWQLRRVQTFTHGHAVQVYTKPPGARGYKRVGPLLFPIPGEGLSDVLRMLGTMAVDS